MFVKSAMCKEEILENGVVRKILGYTDDLMLCELTWQKGMVGFVHSHLHSQCAYIIKGSFEGEVDGEKQIMNQGDCYYSLPNQLHGLVALEDNSIMVDIFTPKRDDFIKE